MLTGVSLHVFSLHWLSHCPPTLEPHTSFVIVGEHLKVFVVESRKQHAPSTAAGHVSIAHFAAPDFEGTPPSDEHVEAVTSLQERPAFVQHVIGFSGWLHKLAVHDVSLRDL